MRQMIGLNLIRANFPFDQLKSVSGPTNFLHSLVYAEKSYIFSVKKHTISSRCCQLSDFVARFSKFSKSFRAFFFVKIK